MASIIPYVANDDKKTPLTIVQIEKGLSKVEHKPIAAPIDIEDKDKSKLVAPTPRKDKDTLKIAQELKIPVDETREYHTNAARFSYNDYLELKMHAMENMRKKIVGVSALVATQYQLLGYSKSQAVAWVKPFSVSYQKALEKVIEEAFPSEGKKVEQVF